MKDLGSTDTFVGEHFFISTPIGLPRMRSKRMELRHARVEARRRNLDVLDALSALGYSTALLERWCRR